MKFNKEKFTKSVQKSWQGMRKLMPIITVILLLISFIQVLIPTEFYAKIFTGNFWGDLFTGSALGSVLTGNPITGYILGHEFLKNNVSLVAVTSFLVCWTTVGFVQYPVERVALGKKFAGFRNISAFFISMLVAGTTVLILNFFN
jgi:uncharacterized membrane protein YraQ (UPF0718 family)